MLESNKALLRLKEGNKEFLANSPKKYAAHPIAQKDLAPEQEPFAIILGCSDSRVPVEIVFSQGLGDLFTIRVAGNIVASSQLGSIELAVEKFGIRLIVVLGHSECGAIKETIESINGRHDNHSPNFQKIIDAIRPGISEFVSAGESIEKIMEKSVKANIQVSVDKLRKSSKTLNRLIERDNLKIMGAEYCLYSGKVEFLD